MVVAFLMNIAEHPAKAMTDHTNPPKRANVVMKSLENLTAEIDDLVQCRFGYQLTFQVACPSIKPLDYNRLCDYWRSREEPFAGLDGMRPRGCGQAGGSCVAPSLSVERLDLGCARFHWRASRT
jgi:hypothetical protein